MPRLCRHFVVPPQHRGTGPDPAAGSFSLDTQRPNKTTQFVMQRMIDNNNKSRGDCQRFCKDWTLEQVWKMDPKISFSVFVLFCFFAFFSRAQNKTTMHDSCKVAWPIFFFFCSLSDFLVTPTLFPLRGLQPVQFAHKATATMPWLAPLLSVATCAARERQISL